MLAEDAFSKVPEISIWATRALFEANAENLLLNSSGPRAGLPIVAKMVADEMLVKRRGTDWAFSQDRCKMLLAVAAAKKDAFEGERVLYRLETIMFLCRW